MSVLRSVVFLQCFRAGLLLVAGGADVPFTCVTMTTTMTMTMTMTMTTTMTMTLTMTITITITIKDVTLTLLAAVSVSFRLQQKTPHSRLHFVVPLLESLSGLHFDVSVFRRLNLAVFC